MAVIKSRQFANDVFAAAELADTSATPFRFSVFTQKLLGGLQNYWQ